MTGRITSKSPGRSRRAVTAVSKRRSKNSRDAEAKVRPLSSDVLTSIRAFFQSSSPEPFLLLHGDAGDLLKHLPASSIDTCLTSPPYWAQRRYDSDSGLGQESSPDGYAEHLAEILTHLRSTLKPTGSLWLNLGDTYDRKRLSGVPWRTALVLSSQGWILRNAIVWDKVKGNPCNAKDKLRNTYEMLFHFVLQEEYYYDVDAIRNEPAKPSYRNGKIVTPTGVSGQKYEEQIRTSRALSNSERVAAIEALHDALRKVQSGELPDFRMIIRGQQRATHSNEPEFSGRATELNKRGFCILPYHRNGTKPGDVWRVIPEDQWRTDEHFAVFPTGLCEVPIRATCPPHGIVLDPFVGTGSAIAAALLLGRRGLGIDTSRKYLATAEERLQRAFQQALF